MKKIKITVSFILSVCIFYGFVAFLVLTERNNEEFNFMKPINIILFSFGWTLGNLGYILLVLMILGLSFGIYKLLNFIIKKINQTY